MEQAVTQSSLNHRRRDARTIPGPRKALAIARRCPNGRWCGKTIKSFLRTEIGTGKYWTEGKERTEVNHSMEINLAYLIRDYFRKSPPVS